LFSTTFVVTPDSFFSGMESWCRSSPATLDIFRVSLRRFTGVVCVPGVGDLFASWLWAVGLRFSHSAETLVGLACGTTSAEQCPRPVHVGSAHSMAFFVPNVAQNFAFKTPLPHLRVLSAVFSNYLRLLS
jgi:hypothetical protein